MGRASGVGRWAWPRLMTARSSSPTTAAIRSGASPMPSRSGAAIFAAALALSPLVARAGDAAKGADVFQDRCSSCHVLNGIGQGPSLLGVVGRKAGALPNFNYSDALKASG